MALWHHPAGASLCRRHLSLCWEPGAWEPPKSRAAPCASRCRRPPVSASRGRTRPRKPHTAACQVLLNSRVLGAVWPGNSQPADTCLLNTQYLCPGHTDGNGTVAPVSVPGVTGDRQRPGCLPGRRLSAPWRALRAGLAAGSLPPDGLCEPLHLPQITLRTPP